MRPRPLIIHPVLLAIFPVLSLYLANSNQVRFQETFGSLILVLSITLLIWAGLNLFLKNLAFSAIITSTWVSLFFSFAHFMLAVMIIGFELGQFKLFRKITRDQGYLLLWLAGETLLWLAVMWWISRSKKRQETANQFLNFFGLVLIVVSVAPQMAQIDIGLQKDPGKQAKQPSLTIPLPDEPGGCPGGCQALSAGVSPLPDIYYIILDGYGRSDILESRYGIDNHAFIDFLVSKGFYIASESLANYAYTAHSLASSLNFDYLEALVPEARRSPRDILPLLDLMEENRTFRVLQKIGYTSVAFSNGYTFTTGAAYTMLAPTLQQSNFQGKLLDNTPLFLLTQRKRYDQHRQRIVYALDHLPSIETPGPKIVVAHIISPHPPFIFGPNGEALYPARKFGIDDGSDFMMLGSFEEYQAGYKNQLIYISNQLEKIIETLLNQSDQPPIIILQGDHGPRANMDYQNISNTHLDECFPILNAYYFPAVEHGVLYPEISPVNTFRVVLNTYFGADYALLEDRSYFSTSLDVFTFTDVTDVLESSFR